MKRSNFLSEWPTLAVLIGAYTAWFLAIFVLAPVSLTAAVIVAALAIAQHASLTHEAIHGHPFRSKRANAALVWPALGLLYPYARFRDTHLAHHLDCDLTDPYDDPESNFLAPSEWRACAVPLKWLLEANNTLLGRLVLGPVIGTVFFLRNEVRLSKTQPNVLRGWLSHVPAVLAVLLVLHIAGMPFGAYLLAAYIGNALIRIRTFLEHRAHETARGRSVIIEDSGPLALLFLNNNLHAVHHLHPGVPWFRLPRLYRARQDHFLRSNDGYRYASYGEVFREHLLTAKDPVAHPLYRHD
ncbi:MAG: fatty acid desaturase [Pseudomonadota bacterium]